MVSTQSVAVSAGDSVDLRCEPDSQELFAGSTGDVLLVSVSLVAEIIKEAIKII